MTRLWPRLLCFLLGHESAGTWCVRCARTMR